MNASKKRKSESTERVMYKKRSQPALENSPPVTSIKDLIEIGKTIKFYKNLDTIMLWRIVPYLEELDKMIGMKTLKESIFYQVIYYLQNMHTQNENNEYLHTLIIGESGTGKTTVSRIIGKIYQSMGILSYSGPFRIAYRDDFIAEYLGQTAIKTRKLLNSCIGGVLFIDEVYSLGSGVKDRDSFSKEALDTITAFLSEHKNDFCCIAAGYEDDIKKCFLGGNKGLERRFPWVHIIDKYTPTELAEVLLSMISDMKWITDVSKTDIADIIKNNIDYFKNSGGDIETFISKCKMTHSKRVFPMDNIYKFIITKKDMLEAIDLIKKHKINDDKDEGRYLPMYM